MPLDGTNFRVLTKQQVSDLRVLRKARDRLNAGRWIQHSEYDGQGGRCAIGWLVFGNSLDTAARVAVNHLTPLLSKYGPPDEYLTVAAYNDMPSRRKADIVRLFNRAIEKLEQP